MPFENFKGYNLKVSYFNKSILPLKPAAMKLISAILLLLFASSRTTAQSKTDSFNHKTFFTEDSIINAVINTDLGSLLGNKVKTVDIAGQFSIPLADSAAITGNVLMRPRGIFRLENCYIPPLRLNFKTPTPSQLSKLKSLKLVNGCSVGSYNDQLLLKEYIVYKIYNILTDMSFRVRLINLRIEDSKKKKKPLTLHSFFIEDMDDVAKRNQCTKWADEKKSNTESTNRMHMAFVSVFQYMIGNTDWAVPVGHNIKLMSSKKDSIARPYAVPYDFDYAGLVDANYATPDEQLGTKSVRERVYRGFPRNLDELKIIIKVFTDKKEQIYSLIEKFEPLTSRNRKEMAAYLDEFYNSIKTDNQLKDHFIDNARSQ